MEQNTFTDLQEPEASDDALEIVCTPDKNSCELPESLEQVSDEESASKEHAGSFNPLELLEDDSTAEEVTNRVFTVANIVSILRLCLIPVFVVLVLDNHDYMATFVFALAAGTDFIDGYLARSTHSVSRLGRVLDPMVDRLLMIAGVICVFLVGRLPLWIIVVIVLRDAMMLIGGSVLLAKYRVRIPVIIVGKAATASLFVGFIGLLLNWPLIDGLGIIDISWLPGLNADPCSWGIWFVYLGLVLGLISTIYYVTKSLMRAGAIKGDTGE